MPELGLNVTAVEVTPRAALAVRVARELAVRVVVPERVVVVLVKVVVAPKVMRVPAAESRMSFPVTWRSSATATWVLSESRVRSPAAS